VDANSVEHFAARSLPLRWCEQCEGRNIAASDTLVKTMIEMTWEREILVRRSLKRDFDNCAFASSARVRLMLANGACDSAWKPLSRAGTPKRDSL